MTQGYPAEKLHFPVYLSNTHGSLTKFGQRDISKGSG